MQPWESGHGVLEGLFKRFNLGLLFEQADTTLSVQRFLIVSGCFGFVGGAACIILKMHIGLALLVAVSVGFLPLMWILFVQESAEEIRPATARCPGTGRPGIRAGHSLAAGLNLVSHEMNNPIAKEFERVFEETNLGIPMEDALENMTMRIPNLDLRFFATAVILQHRRAAIWPKSSTRSANWSASGSRSGDRSRP